MEHTLCHFNEIEIVDISKGSVAVFGYNFTILKIALYSCIHSITVSKIGGHKFEGESGETCGEIRGRKWKAEM